MGANLSDLVPELAAAARDLIDAASTAGLQPRVTSALRSHAEQKRLYSRFLAGNQYYNVAPPGQSAHEYGMAFDMVVSPMEALEDVGYTWQQWGGGWNQGDAVHFELLGASALARQQQPTDSIGAQLSGGITTIFDLWNGSAVASLLQLVPGLSKSRAIKALAQPYESFQQWLISSIKLPGLK
jgi:D-alanyl-D-alanine carboxypeptidase